MGYRLGIDLGTTYTAAAICADGRAEMLALGDRSPIIPSVVAIREDGTVLTGEAAERRAAIEPDRVAREFKRRFGDPAPLLIGGTPYSAQTLQAHLLEAVVAKATERQGRPPDRIAITFPANWGPYKRELIPQMISTAGLDPDEVDLLTEPEAAAIHYASQNRVEPGSLVAVYDLGGGTFDAAVLRKTADGYEIAGPPSGIEQLGGIDFDEAVWSYVQRNLDEIDIDPDDPDAVAAMAGLRRECVDGKEALAADTDTEIVAMLPGFHERIRLTRAEFEDMARPSIEQTVSALERAVVAAGAEPSDLTSVLLVGGSSRIPLVAQMVGNAIGRPVAVDTHPKYAIALGAALFGVDVDDAEVAPQAEAPVPPVAPPPAPPSPGPPPEPLAARAATATPAAASAAAAPPPTATSPPVGSPPRSGAGPADDEPRRRGLLYAGVAVVLALVAAAAGFVLLGGDSAEASELVLEGRDAAGQDPFSTDPALGGEGRGVTPVTFDIGDATGDTIVVGERGTAPGLYGGTQNDQVCDPDALVLFLEGDPDKAAAWAGVHGIAVDEIADFVDGLTPVTLLSDTRVTNHGFADGAATRLQSVLEAGTAVLVDEFGVPRVKCNCGNPLLEPETISGSVEQIGTPWPDFDPTRLVAVTSGDRSVSRFVLTDLDGGDPFSRGVGTSGEDDLACDESCGLPLSGTTPDSTTTTSSSTTTSTTDPETAAPVDITADGFVDVSSVFGGGEFPSDLALDGDFTTSWFSAGPEADGASTFDWFLPDGTDGFISEVELFGNGEHSTPDFRTDFGFEEVELLVSLDGEIVFQDSRSMAGTPDPSVLFEPGVVGDIVSLTFFGSEDPDCGGFAEIFVFGNVL